MTWEIWYVQYLRLLCFDVLIVLPHWGELVSNWFFHPFHPRDKVDTLISFHKWHNISGPWEINPLTGSLQSSKGSIKIILPAGLKVEENLSPGRQKVIISWICDHSRCGLGCNVYMYVSLQILSLCSWCQVYNKLVQEIKFSTLNRHATFDITQYLVENLSDHVFT